MLGTRGYETILGTRSDPTILRTRDYQTILGTRGGNPTLMLWCDSLMQSRWKPDPTFVGAIP